MIFDVIVLIITLISAFIAFLRGLIREVLTIFGVVGGLAAAWYAGPILLPYMENWLGVKEGVEPEKLLGVLPYDILAVILAYGVIFIVVALVLSIVSHILAETARAIGLGPVDRTLGVIFGIARGILLVSIPVMVMQLITSDEQRAEWFKDSKTYFYVDQVSVALLDMVPDSTVEKFKEDAETIKESAGTREKLQQMDILKGGAPREEELPPSESGTEGYTNEFRDEMDQLFENRPSGQERRPADPADEEPNE
ncbi:MAG TPA: CvpA family protein [Alphaproteobacteria bacterium]|nr:CvpA family protein [Micavibrio sp.]HQX27314.1 CvpA family protein [Alphaproteobacteria bacterium]